jgi:Fur family ferric uptake transcriptional regulator
MASRYGQRLGTIQRPTRQRTAIRAALEAAEGFRTAQEIHQTLRQGGDRVGLSTVYRTLQGLAEAGEVDVLWADGETRYRCCKSSGHHHHLVCRTCGHSVEITSSQIERWATTTARRHGFTDLSHSVEVFGVCPDCS